MIIRKTPTDDQLALFRTWLHEHAGLLYKVAYAFAPTEADRDDLIQEVLLQLWVSMPRFQGEAKPSTWIYRLALNTALAWKRKEKKHASGVSLLRIEDLPANPAQNTSEEREERVDALYAAIRLLPKIDAALVMMYLDDLSYRDMAEILGISESNIGVKLHRIKKTLVESIKEAGHEPG
jgi:RNA polymerase sigma-70 factor, ECF subfamily